MSATAVARPEPRHVQAIRALLYAAAIYLYLIPLSSLWGVAAAVLLALPGLVLAGRAHRRGLRLPVAIAAALLAIWGGLALGDRLPDLHGLAGLLGVDLTLHVAEAVGFGLVALAGAFLLRYLALTARSLSLFEVLFVAGSAVVILADHRNRMINRPRFFADWVWSMGLDPSTVLMGVGFAATLGAILLFLRRQPLLKLVSGLVVLLLVGLTLFTVWDQRVEADSPDPLGLAGGKAGGQGDDPADGRGGAGGGGGGASSDLFKDSYSSKSPPSPVAIAILRDDFEPNSEVLYFRQTALSRFNGHHLVSGADQGRDADVITRFPREGTLTAPPVQSPDNHIDLPTTMYLLVDHPQPIALSHATRLTMVENPNPQQFVAAYDVVSRTLSVEPTRLLGRRSVPPGWSAERRRYYTALPDDPRYRALADIIVRDVDPRFATDDLARAYAIKRYLEREGFYTMKSKHSSRRDPTASFLFGSLRGYCVHFAHAAVFLMRSQGIAARVALGYAVQINKRSGGSTILIMSDRAHAWPEIHLEGIGWVTFDVYPERTDMEPPTPVDYDLEKLLGELARDDDTAGISPDATPWRVPWLALLMWSGIALGGLLTLAYLIKIYRRVVPGLAGPRAYPRLVYVAVLDAFADLGLARRAGETRERHAARLARVAPHMEALTRAHLARALGGRAAPDARGFGELARAVRRELRQQVKPLRRLAALLNPLGWLWTR